MGFVAACRKMEDRQEKREPVATEDLLDLVVAQGTMMMETYLEPRIAKVDVIDVVNLAVDNHAKKCGESKQSMAGTFQLNEAIVPQKYRGLMLIGKYLGMNSSVIAFFLLFHDSLSKLIEGLAK